MARHGAVCAFIQSGSYSTGYSNCAMAHDWISVACDPLIVPWIVNGSA